MSEYRLGWNRDELALWITWSSCTNLASSCAFLFVQLLGMTDLFFPSRRILRDLSASTPVISVMWLSAKFRKTSCCRCDRCWILVMRLCWRLSSCSPSPMASWGHSSRQHLRKLYWAGFTKYKSCSDSGNNDDAKMDKWNIWNAWKSRLISAPSAGITSQHELIHRDKCGYLLLPSGRQRYCFY